jgi:hypothetical protein
MPIPFSNRDFSVLFWQMQVDDNLWYNISDHWNEFPHSKGIVRCTWKVGGWEIRGDETNPNKCKANYLVHSELNVRCWNELYN